MSAKPSCAVRGAIHPGAMCGSVIVGSKLCGFSGHCEHQREPTNEQVFRECAANGSGRCRVGPHGPKGELQCEWCGEAP